MSLQYKRDGTPRRSLPANYVYQPPMCLCATCTSRRIYALMWAEARHDRSTLVLPQADGDHGGRFDVVNCDDRWDPRHRRPVGRLYPSVPVDWPCELQCDCGRVYHAPRYQPIVYPT